MTLAEFKAWFEGFTETLEAAPNEKQWERIKARVAEINGAVTTYPVFIDRYVPPYRQWWDGVRYGPSPVFYGTGTPNVQSVVNLSGQNSDCGGGVTWCEPGAVKNVVFNPTAAMRDLGKVEYRSLDS